MKSKNIFNIIISKIVQFLVIIHQKFYGLYVRLRREKNKTKVFCIGFSKTGTTSLDKALASYLNISQKTATVLETNSRSAKQSVKTYQNIKRSKCYCFSY